jgi:hypothetical protein
MLLSTVAWADVTGTWNISGQARVKVAIKGHGSETETADASDRFVFGPNNLFGMTDFDGTWASAGKKVFINLDAADLAAYFRTELEAGLEDEDIDADIEDMTVTVSSFSCKENKDGTIKGSWKLVLHCSIYVPDSGRSFGVSVNSKTTFTGTRAASAANLSGDPVTRGDSMGAAGGGFPIEVLVRRVQEALSGAGLP